MQPNQVGYMYYPRVGQPENNKTGLLYNNNMNNYSSSKDGYDQSGFCYGFLGAFSHLPCLPSSMSRITRGIIGILVFFMFLSLVAIGVSLIPLFLKLTETNELKETFSIDVINGLSLQSPTLSSILNTADSNRTIEQNATLLLERDNLSNELNNKAKIDANIQKFVNIRFTPNQQGSVDASFTIITKPMSRSELKAFTNKLPGLMRASNAFGNVKLADTPSIFFNSNANFAEPVLGELSMTPIVQLSESQSLLNSQIASLGVDSMEDDLKQGGGGGGAGGGKGGNRGPNRQGGGGGGGGGGGAGGGGNRNRPNNRGGNGKGNGNGGGGNDDEIDYKMVEESSQISLIESPPPFIYQLEYRPESPNYMQNNYEALSQYTNVKNNVNYEEKVDYEKEIKEIKHDGKERRNKDKEEEEKKVSELRKKEKDEKEKSKQKEEDNDDENNYEEKKHKKLKSSSGNVGESNPIGSGGEKPEQPEHSAIVVAESAIKEAKVPTPVSASEPASAPAEKNQLNLT